MKIQKKLSALRRADAKTDEKIAKLYPAEWQSDAVFRKSWKKYLSQAGLPDIPADTAEPRPLIRRTDRFRDTHWAAAACLLVTVGLTGVLGWKLMHRAETPPVIVQNSTVPLDEIESADSAATDETEPRNTALPPQTTESTPSDPEASGTAVSGAVTTAASEEVPAATSAAADTAQTTVQTTRHSAAESSRTAVSSVQEPPPQTELIVSTEAEPPAETEEPGEQQEPPAETTTGGSQQTHTPGFQLVDDPERPEIHLFYYFADTTPYDTKIDFSVTLPDYSVTIERPSEYSYRNTIENTQTGVKTYVTFHSGVSCDAPFRRDAAEFRETTCRGGIAYLVQRPTALVLYWFDGRYLCSMHTNNGTEEDLLAVAEAMVTH